MSDEGFFSSLNNTSWLSTVPHSPTGDLFRKTDFSSTVLGAQELWKPPLRTYISLLFADTRGSVIFWGSHAITIYNDEYATFLGEKNPFMMGQPFREGLPDAWEQVSNIFEKVKDTQAPEVVNDIQFFLNRSGFMEETYFVGQFIPLRGDTGEIEGVLNTVHESTQNVLNRRQERVTDRIANISASNPETFLIGVVDALRENPHDIPFALVYAYDDQAEADAPDTYLRGSIAVPDDNSIAPAQARLYKSETGIIPHLRTAMTTDGPYVLEGKDGKFEKAPGLFEDVAWAGHGEPSSRVVIVPLLVTGSIRGFFVQGTNPRRPYEPSTLRSILGLSRFIESEWAKFITVRQMKQRELHLEQRALESESQLRQMAHHAPLGMCQVTPEHEIKWANDQFYDICGADRTLSNVKAYINALAPEERNVAEEHLKCVAASGVTEVHEYRLLRRYTVPCEDEESDDGTSTLKASSWVLSSSFPFIQGGKTELIMIYVADISHQKWAESVQAHNAVTAQEAKRRQEEFIDTTTHEMRNPLTAIMQLADGISRSLDEITNNMAADLREKIADNVESANTILLCANHQKRVIDDVLTLSRLESRMLTLAPKAERPKAIMSTTMKMFEAQMAAGGIKFSTVIDETHGPFDADTLIFDASRFMQVLINLLTNSIKFTMSRMTCDRKIKLTYGVATEPPRNFETAYGEVTWSVLQKPRSTVATSPALPIEGDRVYLFALIEDTGVGMTPSEMTHLFQRFSQASPRTHVTYGGSGLGLYICHELVKVQKGRIGVSSRHGEGSCFAFYIETRRPPPQGPRAEHARQRSATILQNNAGDGASFFPRHSMAELSIANGNGSTAAQFKPNEQPAQVAAERSGFRILLVEDNLINQKVLKKQLSAAGCIVTVANHGVEALQAIEHCDCWQGQPPEDKDPDFKPNGRTSFDVILMDWEMPVMNGLDCSKRIREFEASGQITKHLNVIGVTANVREAQIEQAIQSGMDTVVSKPFVVQDLLETISEMVASP